MKYNSILIIGRDNFDITKKSYGYQQAVRSITYGLCNLFRWNEYLPPPLCIYIYIYIYMYVYIGCVREHHDGAAGAAGDGVV